MEGLLWAPLDPDVDGRTGTSLPDLALDREKKMQPNAVGLSDRAYLAVCGRDEAAWRADESMKEHKQICNPPIAPF